MVYWGKLTFLILFCIRWRCSFDNTTGGNAYSLERTSEAEFNDSKAHVPVFFFRFQE